MTIRCEPCCEAGAAPARFRRRIGIVIPAYDEAAHLPALLAGCRAIGAAVVVVVDDASRDGTAEVLAAERARGASGVALRALRNETNLGKQGTVRRGLRALAALDLDGVALIDGDGQHDPRELPRLAELLARYDMVVGARSQVQMPLQRRLANKLVNLGFAVIGGVNFVDVQSGLRLYRKPLADLLAERLPEEGGYGLEHESLAVLARHCWEQRCILRAVAAPISCAYGVVRSKITPWTLFQLAYETVRQAYRIRRALEVRPAAEVVA